MRQLGHTKVLVTVFLFIVGFGQAADAKSHLKKLLQVPKVLGAASVPSGDPQPKPTPLPPSLLGHSFTQNQVNSCIENVCGSASQNMDAVNALVERTMETDSFKHTWNSEIAGPLANAIQDDEDASVKTVERLEALIKSGQKPRIGHPMQAVVVFQVMSSSYVSPFMDQLYSVDVPNKKLIINQANVNILLKAIDDPTHRAAVQVMLNKVYMPLWQLEFAEVLTQQQNALASRLMAKYPKLTLSEALKTDSQMLLTKYGKVQAKFGTVMTSQMIDDTQVSLFSKAAGGADLSKTESDFYVQGAESVENASGFMSGDLYKALLNVHIDPMTGIQQLVSTGAIAKKRQALTANSAAKRIDDVAGYCRPRLNLALRSTAADAQYAELEKAILAIKSAAKELMPKLMIASAVPTATAAIDNAEFDFPEPVSNQTAMIEDSLDMVANQAKRTLGELQNPSDDLDQILLWTATSVLSTDETSEPMEEVCDRLVTSPISDYTVTAQGKISVSWFSAAYLDLGVPILAHELGHVVSATLRAMGEKNGGAAPGFLKALNCVANRNPFVLKPATLKYDGNTTWSEEDFADRFSDMVLDVLKKENSPYEKQARNMACSFLNTDGNAYTENTFEPTNGDVHSSAVYRLLAIELDRKGTVPSQCQSFVGYATPAHRQLICQ